MTETKIGWYRPAVPDDVAHITPLLRGADRQECEALTGLPPELLLPGVMEAGRAVWTFGARPGEPVGLFGVDPSPAGLPVGIIWMVSTPELERWPFHFLRISRTVVDQLNEQFPVLTNLVDARNTTHVRWLRWMGFSFLRTVEKWGAQSLPFHEFARLKPKCA